MDFALSTRWNARRHTDGGSMLDEILAIGFSQVELGHDLLGDLVPGVRRAVASGAVQVVSVHNFCPVPLGVAPGQPEAFVLASEDPRERDRAVEHTVRTVRFAAEIGAAVVVAHAGRVPMPTRSDRLSFLYERGQAHAPAYERAKLKLQIAREKKARRVLDWLSASVERLLPVLEETGVRLAFETQPAWESVPTELELEEMLRRFGSRWLAYWHDFGHAQVRENLGLINAERWLERLRPYLAGFHVHDVAPPAYDHLMPPRGGLDFARFKRFATLALPRVLEPAPGTPPEEITAAVAHLREIWKDR